MPDYIDAHISIGMTLLKIGNIEDAMGHFERVLYLNPDSVAARKGLNDCLEMQKEHKKIGLS